MEVVGLITAFLGILGLTLKWWWGRRTKQEELLAAIHEKEQELDNAIARNNWEDVSVAHRELRNDLRVLLSQRGKTPPK